jgi:hypothetical protein
VNYLLAPPRTHRDLALGATGNAFKAVADHLDGSAEFKRDRLRLVAILVFALAVGCTGPSRIGLKLGSNYLSITGSEGDQCALLGVPRDGTTITTPVDVSSDGEDWVARSSTSSNGAIELRMHKSGTTIYGVVVAGTARGQAPHSNPPDFYPPRDVIVTLGGNGGTVQLKGTVTQAGAIAIGQLSGEIHFSDSKGNQNTCTAANWLLGPGS